MERHDKIMSIFSKSVRFTGLYPYTWTGNFIKPRKSLLWTVYSIIFISSIFIITGFNLGFAVSKSGVTSFFFRNGYPTLQLANILHEISTNWSLTLLLLILWLGRDRFHSFLVEIWSNDYSQRWTKSTLGVLAFGLVLQFTAVPMQLLAYCLVAEANGVEMSYLFTKSIVTALLLCLMNFVRITQLITIIICTDILKESLKPIKKKADCTVSSEEIKQDVLPINQLPSFLDGSGLMTKNGRRFADKPETRAFTDHGPNPLDSSLFQNATRKIIRSFNLLRLMSDYVNPACAVSMFALTFWLLICVFCFLMFESINMEEKIAVTVMFYTAILQMASFLNCTNMLRSEVWD